MHALNKLNANFNKNININNVLLYIKYVLKSHINLKIIYINVSHGHICHPAIFATFFPIQKTSVRKNITWPILML